MENENSLSVVSKKTENSPKGPLGLIFVHSSILLFVKRVFTRILWSSRFASINQTNISLFCLVLFSSTAAQWFQHCSTCGFLFLLFFIVLYFGLCSSVVGKVLKRTVFRSN